MVPGFRSSGPALEVVAFVGQDLFVNEVAMAMMGGVAVVGRVVQVVAVHHDAVLQVHVHRDQTFVRLNFKMKQFLILLSKLLGSQAREMAQTHWLLLALCVQKSELYLNVHLNSFFMSLNFAKVSFETHFNFRFLDFDFDISSAQHQQFNLFFIESIFFRWCSTLDR